MEVKLKLLNGPNAGQSLSIAGPKYVIGRADGCHLRPRASSVAERHCEFELSTGSVVLRDLGSATGTLVNGAPIVGDRALETGDKLKVGPLEFEIAIKLGLASKKKPKVSGAAEAATRLAAGKPEDVDIDQWLEDPVEESTPSRYAAFLTDEEKAQLGILDESAPAPPPSHRTGATPAPPTGDGDSRKAANDSLNKYLRGR